MKKRLITILLTLAMLITFMPMSAFAEPASSAVNSINLTISTPQAGQGISDMNVDIGEGQGVIFRKSLTEESGAIVDSVEAGKVYKLTLSISLVPLNDENVTFYYPSSFDNGSNQYLGELYVNEVGIYNAAVVCAETNGSTGLPIKPTEKIELTDGSFLSVEYTFAVPKAEKKNRISNRTKTILTIAAVAVAATAVVGTVATLATGSKVKSPYAVQNRYMPTRRVITYPTSMGFRNLFSRFFF